MATSSANIKQAMARHQHQRNGGISVKNIRKKHLLCTTNKAANMKSSEISKHRNEIVAKSAWREASIWRRAEKYQLIGDVYSLMPLPCRNKRKHQQHHGAYQRHGMWRCRKRMASSESGGAANMPKKNNRNKRGGVCSVAMASATNEESRRRIPCLAAKKTVSR